MRKYFILSLVAALLLSCGKDAEKPTVKTLDVAEVTDTTAVCAGEIISNGGAEITSKGVCWSTTQNPTTEDHSVDASTRLKPNKYKFIFFLRLFYFLLTMFLL